jgi:hypothetical protein
VDFGGAALPGDEGNVQRVAHAVPGDAAVDGSAYMGVVQVEPVPPGRRGSVSGVDLVGGMAYLLEFGIAVAALPLFGDLGGDRAVDGSEELQEDH